MPLTFEDILTLKEPFGVLIKDDVSPLSIKEKPIAIKIEIIPISPNSAGIKSRARIIVSIKLITCRLNCWLKVQNKPETVFFLRLIFIIK